MYLYKHSLIISLVVAFFGTSAFGLADSIGPSGSNARAVHELGYTGKGVNVGLITVKNVLATHAAFKDSNGVSHAINHDVIEQGFIYDYHDTPFAGIIISRGSPSHPNDKGLAPDAFIHCARIEYYDDVKDVLYELIVNQSCRVVATGLQYPDTANGLSQKTLMYDYYAYAYDVIFANASGNDANEVTAIGDAYNGITTGGLTDMDTNNYQRVGSIGNPGPTIYGRWKPEVMAPSTYQDTPGYGNGADPNYWYRTSGSGATSWAVPHTAGVAALLLDYVINDPASNSDAGHNVVIKSAIVNSVFPNIDDNGGNSTNPADPNNVWNKDRGYGRLDALRAWQILSADKIAPGVATSADKGWAYESIGNSATHLYYLAGTKNQRLVLTTTWNRRVNKTGNNYSQELSPKFNLDITVKDSLNQVLYAETDDVNNLEKIELILPADGNYTVSLTNTTTKSRTYGLAFELLDPLTGDLELDYIVDGRDLGLFAWQWLDEGTGLAGDIETDEIVNFYDFVRLMDNWMAIDERYYAE